MQWDPRGTAAASRKQVKPEFHHVLEVGGDTEAMLAAFDVYADRLGPDLFSHWTAARAP